MNYVDPICWKKYGNFTLGQKRRMLALYEQFRLSNPWQCKPAQQRCRQSFDCCDQDVYSCVKTAGSETGKCTRKCATARSSCKQSTDCCGRLVCRSGICRAPSINQPTDDDGVENGPTPTPGCRSLFCGHNKDKKVKGTKTTKARSGSVRGMDKKAMYKWWRN